MLPVQALAIAVAANGIKILTDDTYSKKIAGFYAYTEITVKGEVSKTGPRAESDDLVSDGIYASGSALTFAAGTIFLVPMTEIVVTGTAILIRG